MASLSLSVINAALLLVGVGVGEGATSVGSSSLQAANNPDNNTMQASIAFIVLDFVSFIIAEMC